MIDDDDIAVAAQRRGMPPAGVAVLAKPSAGYLISFPLARLGGYLERRWSND